MKATFIASLAVLLLVPAAAALAQGAAPMKIGVVDQDRVLNDSEEGKRLKSDLEKLRNSKASAIEAKERELKGLQEQLMNAQLSLSEEKRDEISRQLKRKRVEYERLSDDASMEFQEAANRAQARLIAMFREVIEKYGAEKGYTLILEANTLYFASNAVDITEELLKRFNEAARPGGAASSGR